MNRPTGVVAALVMITGSGLLASPAAQAATVRCVVRDTTIVSKHLTEEATDAGDGDYVVALKGNKKVQYYLKCTGRNHYGKRQTVWLYRNKREGAAGVAMEFGYANAYRAAKAEALEPAYSKHEFMYINFNWKSLDQPDGH